MLEIKGSFWRRYKLKYPPEVVPADSLVGKCYRELPKRVLQVYRRDAAKNVMFQVTAYRRKKQVACGAQVYARASGRDPRRTAENTAVMT